MSNNINNQIAIPLDQAAVDKKLQDALARLSTVEASQTNNDKEGKAN